MRNCKDINEELENFDLFVQGMRYDDMKDIHLLSNTLIELASMLARSASLVADGEKLLADAKRQAYLNYLASAASQELKWSPMLVRDYVSAQFSEELQCATYADRVNRCLTHTLEGLRSVLSAVKTEFSTLHYQT